MSPSEALLQAFFSPFEALFHTVLHCFCTAWKLNFIVDGHGQLPCLSALVAAPASCLPCPACLYILPVMLVLPVLLALPDAPVPSMPNCTKRLHVTLNCITSASFACLLPGCPAQMLLLCQMLLFQPWQAEESGCHATLPCITSELLGS